MSLIVAALLGVAQLAEGGTLAITSAADLGWLLAYGVIAHAFGLILIASSLTEVPAAGVGIALLLQPALSLIWDVLIFGKALSPIEIAGVLITLAAIFLGSLRRNA